MKYFSCPAWATVSSRTLGRSEGASGYLKEKESVELKLHRDKKTESPYVGVKLRQRAVLGTELRASRW